MLVGIVLLPLVASFAVYDCSKSDPSAIYQLARQDTCATRFPITTLEKKTRGTLLQVPQFYTIPGSVVSVSAKTDSVYCTYTRLRTKLMKPDNYLDFEPVAVSSVNMRNWLSTGVVRLNTHVSTFISGKPIIFLQSDKIDSQGYCKTWQETVSVMVFKVVIHKTEIQVTTDYQGKPTGHGVFGEEIFTDSTPGEGKLADHSTVMWDPKDYLDCPWEKVYSGAFTLATDSEVTQVALFESLTAGVVLKDQVTICKAEVYETSEPRLYVSMQHFVNAPSISAKSQASWSALIRTSILHSATKVKIELDTVSKTVEMNQCLLEQKIQRETIYSAETSPELVGFRLTGQQGVAVVVAGGAIQVVKCHAEEAKLDPQPVCYNKVPVRLTASNESVFMDPVTRVVSPSASSLPCTDIQVPYFEIRGGWYRLIPYKTTTPAPRILPSDLVQLHNQTFSAVIGLYPNEVLNQAEQRWMYKNARDAALNTLIKVVDGGLGYKGDNHNELVTQDMVEATQTSIQSLTSTSWFTNLGIYIWLTVLTSLVAVVVVKVFCTGSRTGSGGSPPVIVNQSSGGSLVSERRHLTRGEVMDHSAC